jgi:lipoyl(octanoyl) transferase
MSVSRGQRLEVVDLGRMAYAPVLALQRAAVEEAIAAREAEGWPGRVYLVEHDPPVVTISRRPEAASHLLASPQRLAALGIELAETDRGGDITYHGPGQLVAYPILDLNRHGLRIHGYMRLLEELVIRTVARFGVRAARDPKATGVWTCAATATVGAEVGGGAAEGSPGAKLCALGVRVTRWVSMHGLALNVAPNLSHFQLIVPCGLHGRAVTSLRRELGREAPTMEVVKQALTAELMALLAGLPDPAQERA